MDSHILTLLEQNNLRYFWAEKRSPPTVLPFNLRCDSHCGAGGPQLPDHLSDEGGNEETQQPLHRPEEVQQLCLLEEEEEEVVLHATPPA